MLDEKQKWISKGELLAYLDDNVVLEPPCYSNEIYMIFDSYNHTGYSRNGEKHIEKLKNDFPYIDERDLLRLIHYLEMAKDYCVRVCCAFAGIYQTVGIPVCDEAQDDKELVVKACQKRYPWIKSEYVEKLLPGVCHMCNR